MPAGVPLEAIEEIIDYEEITETMSKKGEFFALKIKGNSMLPEIKNKDIVIVKKQNDIESGEIGIILVNGNDATCKKIKKTEQGIMLIPINSDYDIMMYSNEEIKKLPLRIIGKVVEIRRSL